jgi:Zn-dependent protease/CBS domain-containing protein
MFRTAYRLPFRLLGIPLQLDVTFLIILPVLTWLIGSRLDQYIELFGLPIDPRPLQQGWTPYALGLLAAVGLFVSVVIHELGHAIVGRAYGVRVRNITLWILGGVAQFEEMPRQRGAEAVVAIAGPITSVALSGICWLLWRALPSDIAAGQFIFGYLVYMNVVLAAFNLLPALPLDGGRVLRSLLALRFPHLRATQIAAAVSKSLAILLGLFGFLALNIFLLLIAFFIYMGVVGETQSATIAELLEGIGVSDLMTREVHSVTPQMSVLELVQKMLQERHLGYPVLDSRGALVGLITLTDIQKLKDAGRSEAGVTVGEIMSTEVNTISQRASALAAFQQMAVNNFGRLIVVDAAGRMTGILSKTDLVRAVQVRMAGLTHLGAPTDEQSGRGLT